MTSGLLAVSYDPLSTGAARNQTVTASQQYCPVSVIAHAQAAACCAGCTLSCADDAAADASRTVGRIAPPATRSEAIWESGQVNKLKLLTAATLTLAVMTAPAVYAADAKPLLTSPAVTITVFPAKVAAGHHATLNWHSKNTTDCNATGAWSGEKNTYGSWMVTPTLPGSYNYGLSCVGSSGSASTFTTLTVTPTGPAPTVAIAVNPGTVVAGQSSTLTWSTTNAASCTASGAWSGTQATSGSISEPTTTAGNETFTLSCIGPGGTTTNSATLTVNSPAPTVAISVNPTTVVAGQSTTLSWSSTNATDCSASGAWSGAQATSGSASEATTTPGSETFTLTCNGPGGTSSNSATLTLNTPAPTVSISVNPTTVTAGQSTTLSWSSTNATDCTAGGAWNGDQATSGSLSEATTTAGTETFTLTCTGPGGTGSNSATLNVSQPAASLTTTLDPGVLPTAVTINQGTAIGQGSGNGATPSSLTNTAADPNNTQTIISSQDPFLSSGNVPDTAAGFCSYSGGVPARVSYVTGSKFNGTAPAGATGGDPSVTMAPYYFPLVYNSPITTKANTPFGTGVTPLVGLFDWRPKDIDEALVAAESDDNGKTWYFMQTVLELNPDYTNPISGGFGISSSNGCPATINGTNANNTSLNGSTADDGWGHASVIQLPGSGNATTGQFLYMLDRAPSAVDVNPLWVINLTPPAGSVNGGASNKFPIWNSNNTATGANDIKSIYSALNNTAGSAAAGNTVLVKQTNGLLNPDGIMAVFPTASTAAAGSPVTVMYVQKILNGDNTGSTAMPIAQQCTKAPFSGKSNHDISNVRLATTTDGVNFTDLGIVHGLNDPTTVDYNKTRWVSPRGTLIDINGDGSRWGLYFAAGNCLDGDSDAFHYIGYAESSDKLNWTVYNDINSPIASINTITTVNQADSTLVTIPAGTPVVPTQPWFAQRLYAPTATRIDATHLSMTFAGYGVQTPNSNLLNYRQIGNVVLTVSQPLPAGVPNNINSH
jgi:hypothetical protein